MGKNLQCMKTESERLLRVKYEMTDCISATKDGAISLQVLGMLKIQKMVLLEQA